jgi:hypothetical protein
LCVSLTRAAVILSDPIRSDPIRSDPISGNAITNKMHSTSAGIDNADAVSAVAVKGNCPIYVQYYPDCRPTTKKTALNGRDVELARLLIL